MSNIKMNPVVSSNIAAAGYDRETKMLHIQFKNGTIYSYSGVPHPMYEGIFTSESAGQFVNRYIIKGKYKSTKLNSNLKLKI